MVKRMAEAMNDLATEQRCEAWQQLAGRSLAEELWTGEYYLLYNDPVTGRCSDTVLANQLAGEWCARLHGLGGVFPAENISKTLETVKRCCVPLTDAGILDAAFPDGSPDPAGGYQSNGIFAGEVLCVAATMAYAGQKGAAFQIIESMPNILDAAGKAVHGTDFYQMMILWALPLAFRNQGISEACSQDQIIDQIIRAAGKEALSND
jgi:uncharacterized protein (DUF608 family)